MEGSLVISPVFVDSLFLNNRSIAYFCGWRVWGREGVRELVMFCGRRKCMAPNHKHYVSSEMMYDYYL